MSKIVKKVFLTEDVFLVEIEDPPIAQKTQPGHHIGIYTDAGGAGLTLPVCGYDREKGSILIVSRVQDVTSERLATLEAGDDVFRLEGPLGAASKIESINKVVLAAEDLGAASLYCRARCYKEKGSYTICILGFEKKNEIFWEEEFSNLCDELYVCTRDGSYGVSGRITNPLRAVCEIHKDIGRIVMIGQLSGMKKVAKVASSYDIPAFMSFDAVQQPAGGPDIFGSGDSQQEAFTFTKAPETDANDIDFDKLLARQRSLSKESESRPAD